MSKPKVMAFAAVAVIVTIAIPAALLKNGVGSEQTTPNTNIEKTIQPQKEFKVPKFQTKYIPQFSSAEKAKKRYQEVECLKSYFGEIKFGDKKTNTPKSNEIENFSANSKSCLVVEYYKQAYKNNKWWGGFRIIWAIKDETKGQGLITVTNSRTYERKLWGNSAAYTLKKDTSKENSWTTQHITEIGISIKDNEGIKNLIPPADETLPGLSDATNYWGFKPDLQNICGDKDCKETEGQMIHNYYSWEFSSGEQNKEIYSWTTGISYWFKKIFGWNEFENKMKEVKGEWKEKPSWSI